MAKVTIIAITILTALTAFQLIDFIIKFSIVLLLKFKYSQVFWIKSKYIFIESTLKLIRESRGYSLNELADAIDKIALLSNVMNQEIYKVSVTRLFKNIRISGSFYNIFNGLVR